uniref:Putative ovule protein n=1 Tax=Solanum chacoense TaxID=4108 RepID=A0A0V0H5N6_SOLCH
MVKNGIRELPAEEKIGVGVAALQLEGEDIGSIFIQSLGMIKWRLQRGPNIIPEKFIRLEDSK